MRFVEKFPTMKERGAVSRLAERLSVTPSAISQWREVPALQVKEVEAATGIPREKLRPDIFGTAS